MATEMPRMGQGYAVPADEEAIRRDLVGFTAPNLHRRVIQPTDVEPGEVKPREYQLLVNGHNSYRITTQHVHTEYGDENEIP